MKIRDRDLNTEVLRVFLMYVIVLGHTCFGPFHNESAVLVLNNLTCFAVNCFVLISGWYSIRFSWRKWFSLLGLGAFASLVLCGMSYFCYGKISFRLSLGWFGCSYLGLMALAPILNAGVLMLKDGSKRALFMGGYFCYLTLIILSWFQLPELHIDLVPRGWGGHTFNTMVFVYVTGRILREVGCPAFKTKWLVAFIIVIELTQIAWLYFGRIMRGCCWTGWLLDARASDYQSPFMLLLAIFVFLVFHRMKFPNFLKRICGWAAPSMFSIYLLHNGTNLSVSQKLIDMLEGGFEPFGALPAIVLSSFVVFVVCLGVDMIRRGFIELGRCVCGHHDIRLSVWGTQSKWYNSISKRKDNI